MERKMWKFLLCGAVVLLFGTGLMFAKSANISILYNGKVGNNLKLAPGKYRMVFNPLSSSSEASFYKRGKLIGTAPVKVVAETRKNNNTEIFYSSPKDHVRRITRIDLSGQKDHLVFQAPKG